MIFLIIAIAFVALAAGTYRQSAIVFGKLPSSKRRVRLVLAGYGLLAVSLLPVLTGDDMPRRLVEWFGLLSLAALGVASACWWRDPKR